MVHEQLQRFLGARMLQSSQVHPIPPQNCARIAEEFLNLKWSCDQKGACEHGLHKDRIFIFPLFPQLLEHVKHEVDAQLTNDAW